jgi:sugar (pentulose or hexulose) kinase
MSLVALDIGTSNTKALLASWSGRILGVRSARTPTVSEAPGELAFPAERVLDTSARLVARLSAEHAHDPVDTLVFSCLGTAMAPFDAKGRPLGPALAPGDRRPPSTPGVMDRVSPDPDMVHRVTGQDPRIPSFLHHWLWWQSERPAIVAELHRFRSLRGYIAHELCGADAEDQSWASRTMLLDLEQNDWSEPILAAVDLPPAALPRIRPSTASWLVHPDGAERFGLPDGTHVVLGGMDNCTSVFGASYPGETRLVNIVGTFEHMAGSGALSVVRSAASATDGLVHSYLLPGEYLSLSRVLVGPMLRAIEEEGSVDIGALLDGVDPEPTGTAMDLDEEAIRVAIREGRPPADVLQGLLESGAALLGRYVEAWDAAAPRTERIVAVGGGTGRGLLLQLKANILDRSVSTLSSEEASGLGALRLAAMAVKGASRADACELFDNPVERTWAPA